MTGRPQPLEALLDHGPGVAVPVDLRDLMRAAQLGPEIRLRGQLGAAHGHPVGLDVIGVAVSAIRVIGDQDLRPDLTDHGHQMGGRLVERGLPEGVGALVLRRAHHPGVPVAARPAEEAVVRDAQGLHRGGQLTGAVRAEGVVAVRRESGQLGRDDLALLAECAGHQGDLRALGRVLGHGHAVVDRLVVGVRMHQQQPAGEGRTRSAPPGGGRPGAGGLIGHTDSLRAARSASRRRSRPPPVRPAGGRMHGGRAHGGRDRPGRDQNLMFPSMPATFVVSCLIVGAMDELAR